MTPSTFLLATLSTVGILIVIRLFWEIILITGVILYAIGCLLFFSLVSTLLWIIFISQDSQGWGWLFAYFFISYSAMLGIYIMIVMDIFGMVIDGLRNFIKSTR